MTHTRTYTYEERALEMALETTDRSLRDNEKARANGELREWLAGMPEESEARVLEAAQAIVEILDPDPAEQDIEA